MNFKGFCILVFALVTNEALSQVRQGPNDDVQETIQVVFTADDYRSRSDTTAPKMVYGPSFFQRFEPESVGDILKRIPGVSGNADAGAFDLPQLRGLSAPYTQITINGKRIPGAENNHTLFVDRIPAHMVARLELIRSPSSDMDAQGVGGTINIVLKDALHVSDLHFLSGLTHFEQDQANRGQAHLSYGIRGNRYAFSVDGSFFQTYNPKRQIADIFETDGERLFKDETNVLDSEESGLRLDSSIRLSPGSVISAEFLAFSTDREEIEDSSFFSDGQLEEGEFDHAFIRQDRWVGQLQYRNDITGVGKFQLSLNYALLKLDNHSDFGIFDVEFRKRIAFETTATKDKELKVQAFLEKWWTSQLRLKLGFDWQNKRRDADQRPFEGEDGAFVLADDHRIFRIDQDRLDLYLLADWHVSDSHQWEAGLRLEGTDLVLPDADLVKKQITWFPSLHYRFQKTENDIFRLSIARTTRRPNFEQLQPFRLRDRPRDNDTTLGNSELDPEFAWGLDVSYEHRFKHSQGMLGLNLFFRKIDDLVVIRQLDDNLFQYQNGDRGETYGLEIDLGSPLDRLKLPNFSIYSNLTLQHSKRTDPLNGDDIRFNNESEYVANFGLLHYLPNLRATYGFNWLTQGESQEQFLVESTTIRHGDYLDVLLEKKWRQGFSIRFAARNLLDGTRDEHFFGFEGLRNEGRVAEQIRESEASGLSFSLTIRGVF